MAGEQYIRLTPDGKAEVIGEDGHPVATGHLCVDGTLLFDMNATRISAIVRFIGEPAGGGGADG